jgi:multiple sugar transport system substrate-binding protein
VQEDIYDFIYQNGGAPINNDRTSSEYTSTATVQALQFYLNLAQVDKVSPMQSVFANTANDKLFCSGKAAMCLFGSWMTSEFYGNAYTKANCDVATIPQGITKATMYNGLGNVVSAQTKNPDASWKWVEYLGTKEANDIQSEYGSAIPAYNGCTAGWEKHFSCFNVSIYPAELPYAVLYPSNYDAYATFSTTEGDILTQACNGKLTAAQACSQLSTGMNKAIASTK